jgi:hypothetical protein
MTVLTELTGGEGRVEGSWETGGFVRVGWGGGGGRIGWTQSVVLGWYAAIPERCSGLVYGVPTERGWCGGGEPRAMLWAGIRCPVGTRGGGERWQSEAVGGPRVVVVVERTRSYPRALLWAGMRCPVGTRGGGERWQGEAVGEPRVVVVVEVSYPERCSGLVYGVPLGHGAEVNVAKMEIGLPFPGGWWMW